MATDNKDWDGFATSGAEAAGPEVTSFLTARERVLESGAWGDLRTISLVEIVQILAATEHDAIIDVTLKSGLAGRVGLAKEKVVFAEFSQWAGEEAFLRLAGERDGGFIVAIQVPPPGRNIRMVTEALLQKATEAATRAGAAPRTSLPPRPLRHEATAIIDVSATAEERHGRRVADFEVLGDLGSGSTALVMRARHVETGEEVALKVLTDESVRDHLFLQRFKREVRTHAVLRHPNIVGVSDFGRVEGTYFLATEPMAATLESLIGERALPAAIVIRLLHDVLRGLAYAHDRGVVHRDINPSNIMLSKDGQAKIADFGLARYELDPNKSSTGAIVGTPRYMSPEQTIGDELDLRSDLFTLGTVAYELLTGRPRFAGRTPAAVMLALSKGECDPLFDVEPTLPPRLEAVVHRLGARAREDRYATAHEALGELAPLAMSVNLRYPRILIDLVENARALIPQLRAEQAGFEARRGHALLVRGEGAQQEAAMCAARALRLDPESRDGRRLVDDLKARGTALLDALDPELMDLEKRLKKDPKEAPTLLRQMTQVARSRGDLLRAASYLLRLTRQAPDDKEARRALTALVGEDARAPFEWADRDRPAPRPLVLPREPTRERPAVERRLSGVLLLALAALVIALLTAVFLNVRARAASAPMRPHDVTAHGATHSPPDAPCWPLTRPRGSACTTSSSAASSSSAA